MPRRRLLYMIPVLLLLLISCQTAPSYVYVDTDGPNRAKGAYGFNQEINGLPQFDHKIGPGPDFRR
jgi:hypothetical protein